MNKEYSCFYIDTLGWYITDKCNLRCKLCVAEIPYKRRKEDYPFALQKKIMHNYFGAVSFTGKITITGGEPFLHGELSLIIDELMSYQDQFSVLNIITNGSVLPGKIVTDMLIKYRNKVIILVDNYGELSTKINDIADLFQKETIQFMVRQYCGENIHCNGWVDYGDYSLKWDSQESQQVFSKCAIPSKPKRNTGHMVSPPKSDESTLMINFAQMNDGLLCHCQRSYNSLGHGVVDAAPEEFIDLTKDSYLTRQALPTFASVRAIAACKYCNGLCEDSVRFRPAQQLAVQKGEPNLL